LSELIIIFPVYSGDRLEYLAKSLESIASSDGDMRLFIGVDGPVSDDVDCYLTDFSRGHSTVELYKFSLNRGLAYVLNDLIDYALLDSSCSFVARMDADDISESNRFEIQIKELKKHLELSVVGAWAVQIDAKGNQVGLIRKSNDDNILKRRLPFDSPFVHPSVVIRASVLRAGYRYPINTIRFEDVAFWSQLAMDGHIFGNIQSPLLQYRLSPSTIVRRTGFHKIISETKVRIVYVLKTNPLRFDVICFVFLIAMIKLIMPLFFLRYIIRIKGWFVMVRSCY
jgi:hypothetical protein